MSVNRKVRERLTNMIRIDWQFAGKIQQNPVCWFCLEFAYRGDGVAVCAWMFVGSKKSTMKGLACSAVFSAQVLTHFPVRHSAVE
jgi:hypothetical protein